MTLETLTTAAGVLIQTLVARGVSLAWARLALAFATASCKLELV